MSAMLPTTGGGCCKPACTDPTVVNIPGPSGPPGVPGQPGLSGASAFTTTTASFTMPAELANVTVQVLNSSWCAPGQVVFVQTAGYFQVVSVPDTSSITLKNLKDTPNQAYMGNTAPTTSISSGVTVTASGIQGPNNPPQLINGNGAPVSNPSNVAAPAMYWDETNKAEYHWNITLAAWE